MPQPDPKDWRLDMVRSYEGYSWTLKPYSGPRPGWDHDHCLACGRKIAAHEIDAGTDAFGYAVGPEHPHGADYEWLCVTCAAELSAHMNWKLAGGPART